MIPFRSLLRIRRELQMASDEFDRAYPSAAQDWLGDAPDLETIRNLQTARAQIDGWIMYRRANGTDQYVKPALKAHPTIDGGGAAIDGTAKPGTDETAGLRLNQNPSLNERWDQG